MFLMDSLIRRCASGVPPELEIVARAEGMDPARFARGIEAGRIVIPANPKRMHQQCAIGEGCQVKINVNIGTSGTRCDPELEEEKAKNEDLKVDVNLLNELQESYRFGYLIF